MVSVEEPFPNQSNQEHRREAHTLLLLGRAPSDEGFGVTKMGQVEVRPWNWASGPGTPHQVCHSGAPQFIIKMVEMETGETT